MQRRNYLVLVVAAVIALITHVESGSDGTKSFGSYFYDRHE
jgi:hypothetical protein